MFIFLVVGAIVLFLLALELAAWALVVGAVGLFGLAVWVTIGTKALLGLIMLVLAAGTTLAIVRAYLRKRRDEIARKGGFRQAFVSTVGSERASFLTTRAESIGRLVRIATTPVKEAFRAWIPPWGLLPGDVVLAVGVVGLIVVLLIVSTISGA